MSRQKLSELTDTLALRGDVKRGRPPQPAFPIGDFLTTHTPADSRL
ncbi:hypothetical protein SAMN06272735_8526 [Streptomyces sp. TLI_55]|nr:hypothetical protein SAMN06272735_8526 [Streptomyces sp. TLI_55]